MPPKHKKGVVEGKKPAPLHFTVQNSAKAASNHFLQKELTLRVLSIVPSGLALCKHNGQSVFLTSGVAGQTVLANITQEKKGALWGNVLEVLEKSPLEQLPFCEYYSSCGGCSWQEIIYPEQLKIKQKHVEEQISKIGSFTNAVILPPLPSPRQQHFRAKMEFAFAPSREEDRTIKDPPPLLGLRERASHLIVPVTHCPVADERLDSVLAAVNLWAKDSGIAPYDENNDSPSGFLRFLTVRSSTFTNFMAVELITAPLPSAGKRIAALADNLLQLPFVASFSHSIKEAHNNIAKGEERVYLLGKEYLQEKLGKIIFDISPESFFQTNIAAAELMQEKVLEFAALTGEEEVWDIYSGVGAISLPLAKKAKRVTGFELSPAATKDAERSAQLNNISNCRFVAGDVKNVLQKLKTAPNVVVLDPPRAGADEDVLQILLRKKPQRIVYVSCNPATLARDLKILSKRYALIKIQPLDMFPHTPHIECIALLEYKAKESEE